MSIYATIAEFGIMRFGDHEFIHIFAQAVPAHIEHTGPQWDFLPPTVDPEGKFYRAVFFVEKHDEQGTERSGHEFVNPLLVLTGKEYHEIRFEDLYRRLEDILDQKYGKRPSAIFLKPGGTEKNIN